MWLLPWLAAATPAPTLFTFRAAETKGDLSSLQLRDIEKSKIACARKFFAKITNDQVRLEGPLKVLGLYTVKIHLGKDIDGELKVWVVPTTGAVEEKKA